MAEDTHSWGAPPPPWPPEQAADELRARLVNALTSFHKCAKDIEECKAIFDKFSKAVDLLEQLTLTGEGVGGAEQYWNMVSDKIPASNEDAFKLEARIQRDMETHMVPELSIIRLRRCAAVLIAYDAGKALKYETELMGSHVVKHPSSIKGLPASPESQAHLQELGKRSTERLVRKRDKLRGLIASLEEGNFQLGSALRASRRELTVQMSRRADTVNGATDEPYRTDRFQELLEMDAYSRGSWISK
ncbi:N-(5-amino-5-carboxypentanoyl)-L-cysteinyl-D-valine synthase [Lasiodiplodia theobromae]|uniref:N-(5-amino-5-carboxypentanoyl)-L-cysteinyl-D- valine synthase n=1 Tax=Lasiodiplodia theobromae TaxID=45133 RepID=UPI0015C31271|nr:N-(5-amino-5-carboxypentanoyl)-L-cysteinyl-D-valine synthase [Lasiodiplodia theobromae]KAF4534315.1 N-(5-amino-5-carboxypentanoyl)-L-cysteinyl-D-valine synthase [Lasiodiplodia theobromae]